MDLLDLFAELLRLMATNPPVVKVNGPSEWVQGAQVAAPFVALGAVGLTWWGLKRSDEQHKAALLAADRSRFQDAARSTVAEAASALQALARAK